MADTEITRTQTITVGTVGENEYHDMLFTDTEGYDYKISNKRVQFFKGKIEPEKTVQLHYAKAYGKEYIYSANLIMGKAIPSSSPEPEKVTKMVKPEAVRPEISGQEHGLWIKELGEWLRGWESGNLPPRSDVEAMRVAMRLYYTMEMKRVLGITIEKKAP